MPQRDIFERWRNITANHARKTRQVFGEHRVALMRHGRAALLTGREIFLRLQHLSALQMAHLGRKAFNRRCDDTKRRKIHRMTVARNDLSRDGLHRKAKLGCNMCLNFRIYVGEGANCARNSASSDFSTGGYQTFATASKFGICLRQFHAKGHRLCVNAMAAADGWREFMLHCTGLYSR